MVRSYQCTEFESRNSNRALKHGHYSKDAIAARRQIAELLKSARRTLDAIS